jgi:hypothetical protein
MGLGRLIINHLLKVSMVCCEDDHPALFSDFANDSGKAGIHRIDSLHRGRHDPGMAHHIRVGIVYEDKIIEAHLDPRHGFFCNLSGTHLGGLIVRGHMLGGRDQDPFLPRKNIFISAIKEIRDMGVLLGLGNS